MCSSELLVTATPSLRPRQGWTSYTHPHSTVYFRPGVSDVTGVGWKKDELETRAEKQKKVETGVGKLERDRNFERVQFTDRSFSLFMEMGNSFNLERANSAQEIYGKVRNGAGARGF